MVNKIPVKFVGLQVGFPEQGVPDFWLVDEPSGSSVKFDSERHVITGLADSAVRRGDVVVPIELWDYCTKECLDSCADAGLDDDYDGFYSQDFGEPDDGE